MAVYIYKNPFVLALLAPAYLMVGTVAITNDFLMGAMFIMATLGLLGAYVTEFPIVSGLYPNEVVHKVAVSSLLGIVFGLVLWAASLAVTGTEQSADSTPISPASRFMATWIAISVPAYFAMAYMIRGLNKRNLEEEHRIRTEKKKNRKGGGPPIMKRDAF
jgi:Mn2+/Fe2+ NRAMP family transporter